MTCFNDITCPVKTERENSTQLVLGSFTGSDSPHRFISLTINVAMHFIQTNIWKALGGSFAVLCKSVGEREF